LEIGSASAERTGWWVHPKGTNSMAACLLGYRNDLVFTGRAISVLFGINGVRNERSHIVGPPFPVFKALYTAMAGWHLERLTDKGPFEFLMPDGFLCCLKALIISSYRIS